MQPCAGRGQRAACPTEVDAAESLLLLGNSGDRCLPPSVHRQDGRRHNREHHRRAPTGSRPRVDGLRRQNSIHPKSRTRLSNALPFSGGAQPRPLQRLVGRRAAAENSRSAPPSEPPKELPRPRQRQDRSVAARTHCLCDRQSSADVPDESAQKPAYQNQKPKSFQVRQRFHEDGWKNEGDS